MKPYRHYSIRRMPNDVLKRVRLLAARLTVDEDRRVTMEQIIEVALRRGIDVVERERDVHVS